MLKLHVLRVCAFLIFLSSFAHGQTDVPDSPLWFHPNQEIRVANLPSITARSTDSSAVLATALETALHDKTLCCGKDSALEDAVLSDPQSLKELSVRLQGRHLLSDGRPIVVNAEYVPQASITSGLIIGTLLDQKVPLIERKSHFYVLYGAIFNETRYYGGARQYALHKLLLLDPRFSDGRREVVFNRETDDWDKVRGLLIPVIAPQ